MDTAGKTSSPAGQRQRGALRRRRNRTGWPAETTRTGFRQGCAIRPSGQTSWKRRRGSDTVSLSGANIAVTVNLTSGTTAIETGHSVDTGRISAQLTGLSRTRSAAP